MLYSVSNFYRSFNYTVCPANHNSETAIFLGAPIYEFILTEHYLS